MPMWLKRLIRPLIPDRLMAKYRLRQHSRQARTNVDVLVTDPRDARAWLGTTPDTYRVGPLGDRIGPQPTGVTVVGDPAHSETALRALAATGADAAVVGATTRPRLAGRRRTEPAVAPTTVAVSEARHDEVGGVPDGDLVGFLDRLRDAGNRLALVPTGTVGDRPQRRDPLLPPVVVMFAGVPMHDVGGGSRTTQLALELLRRGVTVMYVSVFGSDEGTDLGIRYIHPRLEQRRLDEFDAVSVAERASDPGWVLVEIPVGALRPSLEVLSDRGWRIAYDLIDHWADRALGGEWYRPEEERRLLSQSEVVFASAPDLVSTARAGGATAPILVPNAVNEAVFGGDAGSRPDDLPFADTIVGYHGSLYGDWIDWDGIAAVARALPQATVVLIGDASKGHPPMPGNVHFLGLKAQADLPGYVRRFTVGLVPFTVSETTHAVSPLKVYEYLACGVPVAASPLRALDGLDGVFTDGSLADAVEAALIAPRPDAATALEAHGWSGRVDTMLAAMALPSGGAAPAVSVVNRPVVHYEAEHRRL